MNAKNTEVLKHKIDTEEDFVYCPRLKNSLSNFINKHPNGVDNVRIADCKNLVDFRRRG